jgi:NADPH2:quinone reductase
MRVTRRVVIAATGGPEVLQIEQVDLPQPAPGEVRLRNAAIGLNFIDTYFRSGLYPTPLPGVIGSEAVGVVEAIGKGVEGVVVGDRVGCFGPTRGAYSDAWNVPAAEIFPMPDDIDDRTAAAILLKGGTTEFLIERCAKVQPGQTVLVHAAAGGVGHLLVGWLKAIGATVIGTVGSEAKAVAARAAGADHVILNRVEDVATRVREITEGEGVPIVLDGVGAATWEASLKSASRRGLVVSFGNAGGAVTGVNLGTLSTHGSLFVTRPTMFHYYVTAEERQHGIERVWTMLRTGAIKPQIGRTFALADVQDAHRAMEAGATQGSSLLLP